MRAILFACRRTLKSVSFLVMLAVYAAAIFAASLDGAAGSYPPAGVYGTDTGAAAQRVMAYLTENGFVRYDDPEEMKLRVESGELDCGVVLPEDLTLLMEQGDLKECVAFITSPLSFVPQIYQNHVAAALFREYAPYIAAAALQDTAVPQQEMLDEYEKQFESGYVFSFELLTADGLLPEKSGDRALMMGAASLLLFALLVSAGADAVGRDMMLRIGLKRAVMRIILPGVLIRSGFAFAAGSAALALADAGDLILPLAAYALLLSGLSLFLAAFLPDARDRYIFLTVVLILSAALCPIFVDLAMFSPLLGGLRWALAPYWFYPAAEQPLLWLALGTAAVPLGCGAVLARGRLTEKLRIGDVGSK